MKNETLVCSRCKKICREQTHDIPTWFGKYVGDKIVEIICIDCWERGERWEDVNKS